MLKVSAARINRHWRKLCHDIGDRRAGGPGEQAAADYLLGEFERLGLTNARAESFPCVWVARTRAEISVGSGRHWTEIPGRVLAGSPATPGQSGVEGELVWVEMPEQAERLFQRSLAGKVVVLFGPLPTRADLHQRLVRCRPAAMLHVDDRLPFDWVKDDGVYPAWVRRYGMPPIAAVPFRLAWELKKQQARRARVRLEVDRRPGASQNVVAEIAGKKPDWPVVLLGAHHDTQCHNRGADDNASGVVALLELAALLAKQRPLRTIRFVSFGAEEQLSVGAAQYTIAHRRELGGVGAVLNFDSVSSWLGHHWMLRAGSAAFGQWLVQALAGAGLEVVEKTAPMPFADHFPFSVFGVPSVTFYRPNMDAGMRWQHHSQHDNLENVSVAELGRVIKAVGAAALSLANGGHWPFPRGLATGQRAETGRLARELYDLGIA